jgi:hypothetical protein
VTGVTETRAATCLPALSSATLGFDALPFVTDTAAPTARHPVLTWTPVSQLKAVTSGSPRAGVLFPTLKVLRQPRPRMRSNSSAVAGTASSRSEVRYWYASG